MNATPQGPPHMQRVGGNPSTLKNASLLSARGKNKKDEGSRSETELFVGMQPQ